MAEARLQPITLEGVTLVFRNFAGKEGQFNAEGNREFSVLLDTELAEAMLRDGWNIRWLKPREDDEEQLAQAYIGVSIKYRGRNGKEVRPPRVVLITSRGRTNIGEDEIETLDWVDIVNVDLIIRPYEWAVNGKGGVKAYLQSLYITINEDPLEAKYAEMDLEELPARAGRTDERYEEE
jgi:hypothetical protein